MDDTDTARLEALHLLRLIAELEWELHSPVKLSAASEATMLAVLTNAHKVLARIRGTLG